MSAATGLRAVLLVILLAACTRPPPPTRGKGELDVRWTGSNGGSMAGPAVAEWCEYRRMLEIRMVHGDTGVALALYPAKALGSGMYPVVQPARAESVPPAAGLAVRWLAQTTVQGFQGDSGQVSLKRSARGQLSGSVAARARSVVDTQRIRITGTFRDLTIVPDTLGCDPPDPPDEDAGLEDTGVD